MEGTKLCANNYKMSLSRIKKWPNTHAAAKDVTNKPAQPNKMRASGVGEGS